MVAPELIAIWGATAIAAAVAGGILANIKNRDYSFWIAMSFLLPPAVVVLILLPRLKERPVRISTDDDEVDSSDRA
ncbi:MAG TPA: hypothetical protein VNK52_02080 [Hyphomicrobiaceae bacterium]|nr:hypothetical protein [Hyphomicrobiaceae bacterium]